MDACGCFSLIGTPQRISHFKLHKTANTMHLLAIAVAFKHAYAQFSSNIAGMPTTGDWQAGKATHYGPYPQYPPANEVGYQPLDVGVGCSNGGTRT
jgi:hypothetical protein